MVGDGARLRRPKSDSDRKADQSQARAGQQKLAQIHCWKEDIYQEKKWEGTLAEVGQL